jgi:hypothetical protein
VILKFVENMVMKTQKRVCAGIMRITVVVPREAVVAAGEGDLPVVDREVQVQRGVSRRDSI